MNAALFAVALPVGPTAGLAVCAVVALAAVAWGVYNHVSSQPQPMPAVAAVGSGGFLGNLEAMLHAHTGGMANSRLAGVLRAAGKHIIAFDEAENHKTLNALIAHFAPKAAPAVPVIDKGLDLAEARLAGSTMLQPAAPTIQVPAGHPVLNLLQKVLEASVNQQQPAAASK